MEWIENQMAEEMYDVPTEDDMEDFVGGNVYDDKLLNTVALKLQSIICVLLELRHA